MVEKIERDCKRKQLEVIRLILQNMWCKIDEHTFRRDSSKTRNRRIRHQVSSRANRILSLFGHVISAKPFVGYKDDVLPY